MKYVLFFLFLFNQIASAYDRPISEYEQKLISHVQESIDKANQGISKLSQDILTYEGLSSSKVRHFLNNVCSLPNAGYLEIGIWKGSTLFSALYKNFPTMSFAVAVDNWSEFNGAAYGWPRETFHMNSDRFLKGYSYQLCEADSFTLDLGSVFSKPVTIYFYDGCHYEIYQEMAFTYYNSVLDDVFIAMIDHWSCEWVKNGTRSAFQKLNYEILFEKELPGEENWWAGLYVAVIRKSAQ